MESTHLYEYPIFNLLAKSYNDEHDYREITLIHYMINDFVLFMCQLIVDIALVVQIKRDLHQKRTKIKSTMNRKDENAQKKLDYLSHVSNETNRMIVYSLLLNAFYRLPEFALY